MQSLIGKSLATGLVLPVIQKLEAGKNLLTASTDNFSPSGPHQHDSHASELQDEASGFGKSTNVPSSETGTARRGIGVAQPTPKEDADGEDYESEGKEKCGNNLLHSLGVWSSLKNALFL